MSKTYQGTVSIVANTKGNIALKADPEGQFSAANAAECYTTMVSLAQSEGMEIDQWSLFQPKGGTKPVLLANRFGNPYILLAVDDGSTGGGKPRVRKLA